MLSRKRGLNEVIENEGNYNFDNGRINFKKLKSQNHSNRKRKKEVEEEEEKRRKKIKRMEVGKRKWENDEEENIKKIIILKIREEKRKLTCLIMILHIFNIGKYLI